MIRHLSDYLEHLLEGASISGLLSQPPVVEFRPSIGHCPDCGGDLKLRKTRTRRLSTLHVGRFRARELFLVCEPCGHTYRSEELRALAPPGGNFGYDVMVYAGRALFLRHRTEREVVEELARKNIPISPRGVSLLGMKFIVYLALAQQRRAPELTAELQSRGGYICHLDATCEGRDPFLMSSIDSLSEIVLGNVKLPAEDEKHIVPFLERIKRSFGVPLALVHDMGKGILKAVDQVFPGVPDFVCHFHFLRDIGKDFLGAPYDTIRRRLSHHGIGAKLRCRAKGLKADMDKHPEWIGALPAGIEGAALPAEALALVPLLNAYTLIQWVLGAKTQGQGYGFPFDRPHLALAKRLRRLNAEILNLERIQLRGQWRDNRPYFKIRIALKPIMKDRTLWKAVEAIEAKITVFEKLRAAMRIAPPSGRCGLNEEGHQGNIRTIQSRVNKFRRWLTRHPDYTQDAGARKMVDQIDKYSEKLFADPISVPTPSGPVLIQPQRTNNILEQFFRRFKRANRRRTGNASSSRLLRTMLAETPLVHNLENPAYMKILLDGKASLDELFAQIEIDTFREAFRAARKSPEKIPPKLKALIAMPDFPEKLRQMVERAAA